MRQSATMKADCYKAVGDAPAPSRQQAGGEPGEDAPRQPPGAGQPRGAGQPHGTGQPHGAGQPQAGGQPQGTEPPAPAPPGHPVKTEGAGTVKQEPGEGGPRVPRPRARTLTFNLSDSSAAEAEGPDAAAKAELDFDQLLGNCKFAMDRGAIHSTDSNNVFTLHYWGEEGRSPSCGPWRGRR